MSENFIFFVSFPWNRMWFGVWGKNLVIRIFCLFGSRLNGNLHYLMCDFFLGNQKKFPIQLLNEFHSQLILLFLWVGYSLVEDIWALWVVSPSHVLCFHLDRKSKSLIQGLGDSKRQFGRLWPCKVGVNSLSTFENSIYLFWLCWVFVAGFFSSCRSRGYLLVVVRRFLLAVASPIVNHGL